jgi:serine/threonine protein kinase
MAPEQVAGDAVTPGWDLWALTVIAYEILTGSHPFRRAVAFSSGEPVLPPLSRRLEHSNLSEAGVEFFRAALSTECGRRPPDALSFLAALEEVLA